jgi:hypothetical protein
MQRRLHPRSAWVLGFVLSSMLVMQVCGFQASGAPIEEVSGFTSTIGNGTMCRVQGYGELTILICCDIAGGTQGASSTTSTNPPIQKMEGYAVAQDGRRLDWVIEKRSGPKTACRLNDKDFDLEKGTLFLVRTKDGVAKTDQLAKDLSEVRPNIESLTTFAKNNPEVSALLEIAEKKKGRESFVLTR